MLSHAPVVPRAQANVVRTTADMDSGAVAVSDAEPPEQRRTAMILEHLRLVNYATRAVTRYAAQGAVLDAEDVLAFGVEGLIAAVDSFDPLRGYKFSTWAVLHIRTSIQDALRALDPLPRGVRARAREIERVAAALAHARGEWPSVQDLAGALGMTPKALRQTLQLLDCTEVSLDCVCAGDAVAEAGTGGTLLDTLADDDSEGQPEAHLLGRETLRQLRNAVSSLPEREAEVIDAYYRRGRSMQAIGEKLGISTTRVSQIHAHALALLRARLDDAPGPVRMRRPRAAARAQSGPQATSRRLARRSAA
jgi:RNA polymerase sigma factor for flagellar operon FliA